MIPVKQKLKHDPKNGVFGDCHRAAVASILELELEAVPHFCEDGKAMFQKERRWLIENGMVPINIIFSAELKEVLLAVSTMNPDTFFILGGKSHNGTGHSVVCFNSKIVHDPSPTDSGIIGPMDDGYYWVTFLGSGRGMKKRRCGLPLTDDMISMMDDLNG